MNASPEMNAYFEKIKQDVARQYEIAEQARARLLDPREEVEIPLAEDVASRVQGLVSIAVPQLFRSNLAQRLRELEKKYSKGDARIAFDIAKEVFDGNFFKPSSVEKAIEAGVRVGLGYITLGIVTAPLEGISEIKIKQRQDGGKYVGIYFSGPIRSAGGTANAMAVLLTDYLRREAGLGAYDPNEKEIERFVVELDDYDTRITNLQYRILPEEIRFLVKKLPVEVSGTPTEKLEVLSFKDLPRVETNRIRSGVCLTLSMVGLKARKLLKFVKKHGEAYNLSDWLFFEEYGALKKTLHGEGKKPTDEKSVVPDKTFMQELPGGRPVFSSPSTIGGFRLRYGRSRDTGFAGVGVNPATMLVLDSFIAIGTQLKLERPGKAGVAAPVDSIEGPVVKLDDGSVVRIRSVQQAKELLKKIEKILFLGDILIGWGEFVSNGRRLVPPGYCEEWWLLHVEKAMAKAEFDEEKAAAFCKIPSLRFRELLQSPKEIFSNEAIRISKKLNIPLHPKFTYFFKRISLEELRALAEELSSADIDRAGSRVMKLEVPLKEKTKETLELLCVPHKLRDGSIVIEEAAAPLLEIFSLPSDDSYKQEAKDSLDLVGKISRVKLMEKEGTFIGARMGRPEKAERRLLVGRPQILFPVGKAGGRMRSLNEASGKIYSTDLSYRLCPKCGKQTYYLKCEACNCKTKQKRICRKCGKTLPDEFHCNMKTNLFTSYTLSPRGLLEQAAANLGEKIPHLIKGVRGMSSDCKIPERLEKGILRAKHDLYVNKDGTTRIDATDMPLTHIIPKEINVPWQRLKELGYEKDIHGNALASDNQILELKIQDIIISDYTDASKKTLSSAKYLVRIANFMDDLLENFYNLPRVYNLQGKDDLVGHYVVGLAPHTSAGSVGRIIGFTKARVGYAHPIFHAAKRRNCDGDEDSIMLLLDALINFSRKYLSSSRGASTMDAPLVLTTKLKPDEVDDEVHALDTAWKFPLEFYEKAMDFSEPYFAENIGTHIGTPRQFEGMGFTHPTTDINAGPLITAYKSLGPMADKVSVQLKLAEKILAVDQNEVAALVISTHFIKDIKGNMRTYCRQRFRCVKCNESHRRIPLIGKCRKCGGKLVLTVHKGTIEKYIEPSLEIARKYHIPEYMKQEIKILQKRMSAMFGSERQQSLTSFLT